MIHIYINTCAWVEFNALHMRSNFWILFIYLIIACFQRSRSFLSVSPNVPLKLIRSQAEDLWHVTVTGVITRNERGVGPRPLSRDIRNATSESRSKTRSGCHLLVMLLSRARHLLWHRRSASRQPEKLSVSTSVSLIFILHHYALRVIRSAGILHKDPVFWNSIRRALMLLAFTSKKPGQPRKN